MNAVEGLDPVTGEPVFATAVTIDFSALQNMNYDIDVEIGASTYWSETAQVQTMDSLFEKGILTNPVTYLEGIPDKYIPNKRKIIEELKEAQQMQAQMMAQPIPTENDPTVTVGMQDGEDNRAPVSQAANQQLQDTYAAAKEFYGGNA